MRWPGRILSLLAAVGLAPLGYVLLALPWIGLEAIWLHPARLRYAFLWAVLLGLPGAVMLDRSRRNSVPAFIALGVVVAFLGHLFALGERLSFWLMDLLAALLSGAIGGLTYGLCIRWFDRHARAIEET